MKRKIIYIIVIVLMLCSLFYIEEKEFNNLDYDYAVYVAEYTTTTSGSLATYYSKYHCAGCDYILGKPKMLTLTSAIGKGYAACPRCKPSKSNLNMVKEEHSVISILLQFILKFVTITLSFLIIPIGYKFIFKFHFIDKFLIIFSILNSLIISILLNSFIYNIEIYAYTLAIICLFINIILLKISIEPKDIPTTYIYNKK